MGIGLKFLSVFKYWVNKKRIVKFMGFSKIKILLF